MGGAVAAVLADTSQAQLALLGNSRRIYFPEETFERVIKLAPVMGITRIANITGLDTVGIPVYAAYRPNSRSLSVAQGKGITHAAAKISALMEAVESYHAETIDLPLRLSSYVELGCKHKVADISRISQVKNNILSPHGRIPWIEGEDLLSGEKKFLPYETVHLDYRAPLPCGHGHFFPSSNGLASGNSMLEALIHAICELIERDSVTLFHLMTEEKQNARKVDLGTVDDPHCRQLLDKLRAAHVHVGVWEITSDIETPAFLCRILPDAVPGVSCLRPASGMGCHLSKNIALSRAITEAAQSRLTFISGVRDDMPRRDYEKFLSGAEYAKWKDSICHASARALNYQSIESVETCSLDDDLDALLDRLRNSGIAEVVAVDLMKPEFGIPVVRVVIPGLETILTGTEMLLGQRAERILSRCEAA